MRDGKIVHVKPEDMETLEQIKERRKKRGFQNKLIMKPISGIKNVIVKRQIQFFILLLVTAAVTEALFYFFDFDNDSIFEIRKYAIILMILVFWIIIGRDWFRGKRA